MPGGTVAVASDHAGFDLKEILKRDLQAAGHEVPNFGTNSTSPVDYSDFGQASADAVASGQPSRGSITANRNHFEGGRHVGRIAKFFQGCTQ
jgi:ribose 5-phosphate isomerase B